MLKKALQNYLKFFAKRYLKRSKCQIIAITGSVGKTSTKEAIFNVLSIKYKNKIRKSEGNLNNETGVPLAILDYKKGPTYNQNKLGWLPIVLTVPFKSLFLSKVELLVLEMAADKPGDIKYLMSIAKPNVSVLTAIAPAHLEAFGEIENIVEEKTEIFRALDREGWAIINVENEYVKKTFYGGWWHKKSYGINEKADVYATNIKYSIENGKPETQYEINYEKQKLAVKQNTIGLPAVLSNLAAFAAAKIYNLDSLDIVDAIEKTKSFKHRTEVLEGKNNSVIIDDCYNANPVSMRAAIDILQNLPIKHQGRKIIVLGDMREIGKKSAEDHKSIGEYAKQASDIFIAVGKSAKNYMAEKYFLDLDKVTDYLLSEIKENDIILLKASRGAGSEPMLWPVVKKLKKE